jgi:hypothetical protein
MKIKMSKSQWEEIGAKSGWINKTSGTIDDLKELFYIWSPKQQIAGTATWDYFLIDLNKAKRVSLATHRFHY